MKCAIWSKKKNKKKYINVETELLVELLVLNKVIERLMKVPGIIVFLLVALQNLLKNEEF